MSEPQPNRTANRFGTATPPGEPGDMTPLINVPAQLLGYAPTKIPFTGMSIPGGPVRGLVQSTVLGALLGRGAGKTVNYFRGGTKDEKKRRLKNWTLLGGAGLGVPSLLYSGVLAGAGIRDKGLWGLVDYPGKSASVAKRAFFSSPQQMFPVNHSLSMIRSDPALTPVEKALISDVILQGSEGKRRGLISVGDLTRGAIGAGFGYAGGALLASAMNGLIGLPTPAQKALKATGAIAGALRAVAFGR